MKTPQPPRIEEPFRLFFPIAMLVGIVGVALWPLFYSGKLSFYPSIAHTRLLIQGFAGLFIFGFLMTAGPRLLGSSAFTARSVHAILALTLASSAAHLFNRSAIGDLLFVAAVVLTLRNASSAYAHRRDTPPPGFPLAALGLSCGGLGSLALALSSSVFPNATVYLLGKILLFQGFTLLPIIGVGAFFFPRLLGGTNKHDFPETLTPNAAWKRRFVYSILVAFAFLLSLVFELRHQDQLAYAIRLTSFAAYLCSELPLRGFQRQQSMHGLQLIFTLATIFVGLAGAAFFPGHRIAWLHAYFLTGLTSIIFLVSIRVVFGHSGRPDLIRASIKPSAWITVALIAAALTRILADYSTSLRTNQYWLTAIIWLICGLAWMIFVAPKTRLKEKSGNC